MGNNDSTIREGQFECHAPDQKAYLEDIVSCWLFQLPYKIEAIKFGYITLAMVFIVILISLFGRIKLNYRWFILNLALMDLLTSFDSICSNVEFTNNLFICNYNGHEFRSFNRFDIIFKLPCFGIFLLTGSKFICLYFRNIYKKFEKVWKIILIIICVDLICVGFNSLIYFLSEKYGEGLEECIPEINKTTHQLSTNNSILIYCGEGLSGNPKCIEQNIQFDCIRTLDKNFQYWVVLKRIESIIPVIALLSSVVFVTFLIIKISKEFKFLATSNKESLKSNLRVVIVFSIQTLIFVILFSMDLINELDMHFQIKPHFPFWAYWLTKIKTKESFRIIRVFIDNIVILGFMSGYREDLTDVILWIINAPKLFLKKINGEIMKRKKNSITTLQYF